MLPYKVVLIETKLAAIAEIMARSTGADRMPNDVEMDSSVSGVVWRKARLDQKLAQEKA